MSAILLESHFAAFGQDNGSIVFVHSDLDEKIPGRCEIGGQIEVANVEVFRKINLIVIVSATHGLRNGLVVFLNILQIGFKVLDLSWAHFVKDVLGKLLTRVPCETTNLVKSMIQISQGAPNISVA